MATLSVATRFEMNPLSQPEAFRRALAKWYTRNARALPWRSDPSLYRTVVSEFMLQQTQVATMLPHFERWMTRFPDFQSLAEASPEDVLKHWEGLGYYTRARNLHKLARIYVTLAQSPASAEAWRALPGVGPYTASAISSIAQNYPSAVVDGNVVRILARLTNEQRSFKSNAEALKAFTPTAEALLDREDPGAHNQAMMELGATLCLKRNPRCKACPARRFCAAAASGTAAELPRIERRATEHIETTRLWALDKGRILLHRIPDNAARLAGQYELPEKRHLPNDVPTGSHMTTKVRSITRYRIREHIHALWPRAEHANKIKKTRNLRWISIGELDTVTLSGPHRRWVNELLTLQYTP
ncbi:MAG: A/G-specific adenine glycosylase [Opitutales bacterium]